MSMGDLQTYIYLVIIVLTGLALVAWILYYAFADLARWWRNGGGRLAFFTITGLLALNAVFWAVWAVAITIGFSLHA
jgi:hypothetical protein